MSVYTRMWSRERSACTPSRTVTGRLSWLLRKQTKERNEGTSALGGLAPLFMGHCICWPRITLRERDLCGPTLRPTLHSIHYLLMVAALALGARLSLVYDMPRPTKRSAVVQFFVIAEYTVRGRAIVPRDQRRNWDRDRGRIAMIPRLTSPRIRPRVFRHIWQIGRARARRHARC